MAAAADIVVAAVGADALVVEAVVKLMVAPAAAAKIELVVVAVVEFVVAPAAAAELKLVVVEGGAVMRDSGPGTEDVGDAVWTAAAAYVDGSLESSSSKKRSVGSLGPIHVFFLLQLGRLPSDHAKTVGVLGGGVRVHSFPTQDQFGA